MADLKETEPNPAPTEVPVKEQTSDTKKKASKPKKPIGQQGPADQNRQVG